MLREIADFYKKNSLSKRSLGIRQIMQTISECERNNEIVRSTQIADSCINLNSICFLYNPFIQYMFSKNAGNFCILTTHFDSRMFSNAWEGMKEGGGYICERDDEKRDCLNKSAICPAAIVFFRFGRVSISLSMCVCR